jgi:glycosyltransferase involved in cell wall biosynthesis
MMKKYASCFMKNIVSIIIPAKNEEKHISRCIESALEAVRYVAKYEIILVDSFSEDQTVEIAKQYPIRIIRLLKDWPKSPAAGRYIGAVNSNAEYIFYLDADMAVEKNWINISLNELGNNTNLAGISGELFNIVSKDNNIVKFRFNHPLGIVEYLAGPCLYRYDVLKEAGYFNPYMRGYEEREVGQRISNLGYQQARIDKTVAYHYAKESTYDEILEKSCYFEGVGQFLRLHLNTKNIVEIVKKYRTVITVNLTLYAYLFIMIYFLVNGYAYLTATTILLPVLLFALILAKKRHPKKIVLSLGLLIFSFHRMLRGFLRKIQDISDYPTNVEIIK